MARLECRAIPTVGKVEESRDGKHHPLLKVPLGYKVVPLDELLAVSGRSAAPASGVAAIEIGPVLERGEVEVGGNADVAELARLAARAKAVREAKEAALAAEAEQIVTGQARLEEHEQMAAVLGPGLGKALAGTRMGCRPVVFTEPLARKALESGGIIQERFVAGGNGPCRPARTVSRRRGAATRAAPCAGRVSPHLR